MNVQYKNIENHIVILLDVSRKQAVLLYELNLDMSIS